MTDKEFAGWQAITENSHDRWTEDEIVRLNGRGVMYFIGGEDGAYMRIGKDGKLDVGFYEGAIPHIGEAMFSPAATERLVDYNAAFTRALELGGKKFLADMFSAPDQDEIVQAAWAKLDAQAAEASAAPPAYQLTQADMNEYGYLWPGMQPLRREEALARFDSGGDVFRLYPDDSEGGVDCLEDIENFNGLFGVEIPGYVDPEIAGEPALADGNAIGRDARQTNRDEGFKPERDDKRGDGYTSVLAAIEEGKKDPKPPRKAKDAVHKTKGREEI